MPLGGHSTVVAHVQCLAEVHLDHGCQAVGCHVPHKSELAAEELPKGWEQRQELVQEREGEKTRRHHIQFLNANRCKLYADILSASYEPCISLNTSDDGRDV